MNKQFYEATYTQELENKLNVSKVKPLVEELFYKYGLKVMFCTDYKTLKKSKYTYSGDDEHKNIDVFIMTLDGTGSCAVYMKGEQYAITFPDDVKDRGSWGLDRQTLVSNKMSLLLKNVEKRKAMTHEPISRTYVSNLIDMVYEGNSRNSTYKSNHFNGENIHKMLSLIFDNKKLTDLPQDFQNQLAKTWADYQLADEMARTKNNKVLEFFDKEIYAIGSDANDGYVIGKLKVSNVKNSREFDWEVSDGFRRVMSLSDYADSDRILARLTMLKMTEEYNNGHTNYVRNEYFFRQARFMEDLQIAMGSEHHDNLRCQFLFIPIEDTE